MFTFSICDVYLDVDHLHQAGVAIRKHYRVT